MTAVISMHQARTMLSQLVKRAAAGETIFLGAYGKAETKLVRVDADTALKKRIGILAGKLVVPDDFDAPLPEDVLAAFCGCHAPAGGCAE